MTRVYVETKIQQQIVQFLTAYRKETVIFFAVPNGEKRSLRTAALMKSMGLVAGVSDLVIVVEGRAFFLEVKKPGGRQSPAQAHFEARAALNGSPYEVVDSLERAVEVLIAWEAVRTGMAQIILK